MDIHSPLKIYFGYETFRPLQEEIIRTILARRDCFVVMPTGAGKSLCFQLPALCTPGLTVVISPLIALMHDQVSGLQANGISARYLNSSQTWHEQQTTLEQAKNGTLKLLYVSPERLLSPDMFDVRSSLSVAFFVIDEAHCVSLRGHDFRPEYTKIPTLTKLFPSIPLIAVTATADPTTRTDIIRHLGLREPAVFVSSFDRPNLSLDVQPGQQRRDKLALFAAERRSQAGIVYCLSRKTTEDIAYKLKKQGYKAAAYHAGLPSADRTQIQDSFLKDNIQIICATIAFGMGIDKSNIRRIVHYNLPKTIESYYQEIGRAGRDGLPADTLLFASISDMIMHERMLAEEQSDLLACKRAKLERMRQFTQTQHCRRQMLLSYFGEIMEHPCGNCDICNNPPQTFDGTVVAQKALSAIARLDDLGPTMSIVTDFLRGAKTAEIMGRQLHLRKTYGVGTDLSREQRLSYLTQLLSLGYLDIDYTNHNILSINDRSRQLLFHSATIQLINPTTQQAPKRAPSRLTDYLSDPLFVALQTMRKVLADEEQIPAYQVFSDVTLQGIACALPGTIDDLLGVSGIGSYKAKKYGQTFLDVVRVFLASNPGYQPKITKVENGKLKMENGFRRKDSDLSRVNVGPSYGPKPYLQPTYDLRCAGKTIAEIATLRDLRTGTIADHLATMHRTGDLLLDLDRICTPDELTRVRQAILQHGTEKMKPIFDACQEQISYDVIRMVLAVVEKEK